MFFFNILYYKMMRRSEPLSLFQVFLPDFLFLFYFFFFDSVILFIALLLIYLSEARILLISFPAVSEAAGISLGVSGAAGVPFSLKALLGGNGEGAGCFPAEIGGYSGPAFFQALYFGPALDFSSRRRISGLHFRRGIRFLFSIFFNGMFSNVAILL